MKKLFWKIPFYKLPFRCKLWWAKIMLRMFRGFGETFPNDIILYNELSLWIETNGRPTTSNVNYQINKMYPVPEVESTIVPTELRIKEKAEEACNEVDWYNTPNALFEYGATWMKEILIGKT